MKRYRSCSEKTQRYKARLVEIMIRKISKEKEL
jgi:hypothetical protein